MSPPTLGRNVPTKVLREWRNADPENRIVNEARAEHARLP